jgi:aminoglycoside 3-N-acetyltransferase I
MNLNLQILESRQLAEMKELILLFEGVFEMKSFQMPQDAHLQALLEKDSFFAAVAQTEGKIVGGLTCYVLEQYYSERPLAYLYDLAVLESYQRKGIGKRLIAFVNDFCKQRGFEELFVQADLVDDYAIDFYRSTNPTNEEQVVHFYFTLNRNDDGR